MDKWIRSLEIAQEWHAAEMGDMTYEALAGAIANKLSAMPEFRHDADIEQERQELIERFDEAAEYTDLSQDEFNDLMSELYDWADTSLDGQFNGKKVCWINTFDIQSAA